MEGRRRQSAEQAGGKSEARSASEGVWAHSPQADGLAIVPPVAESAYSHVESNVFAHRHTRALPAHRAYPCSCDPSVSPCDNRCVNRSLMLECHPAVCPSGFSCRNMRFQRKQHLRTSVFDTEAKGFGVFLFDGASAGDFVMEYVGEVLPFAAYAKRKHFYDRRNFQHAYFMRLSADEVIDATRCGNIARFINHSCSPNLETQKWAVGGEMCIGLFALRNIQPGEELSFDYNFQSFGDRPMQCLCRSFNCRKWIGGGGEDTESVHCDSSDDDDEQDDVDDGQRDEVEDDSDDRSDDENDEDFVVCSAQRHIGWHGEQSQSNDKYGWSGCRRKNERSCGSGTRVRTRKMRLPMRKPLSKNAKASCDEERNAYQERSSLREANHTVAATTATQQVQTICGKNLGGCISRSRDERKRKRETQAVWVAYAEEQHKSLKARKKARTEARIENRGDGYAGVEAEHNSSNSAQADDPKFTSTTNSGGVEENQAHEAASQQRQGESGED